MLRAATMLGRHLVIPVVSLAALFASACDTPQTDFDVQGAKPTHCTKDADCDDHICCNGVETCSGTQCHAGTAVTCGDTTSCTYDVCDETVRACRHIPDETQCPIGSRCDPTSGCQPETIPDSCSVDADCDDNVFCNGVEICVAGACQFGTR